jgi:hypothetical protein
MKPLWAVADFVRGMRRRMRFGEFSRAPLQLLRLELRGNTVECDWAARPADVWDAGLRRPIRDRNESLQALADAMSMRDLLFEALPEVESAVLRAFRQSAREPPELIIVGTVNREAPFVLRVGSIVMRAKLYGFCFCLEDVSLRPLELERRAEEFII